MRRLITARFSPPEVEEPNALYLVDSERLSPDGSDEQSDPEADAERKVRTFSM